MLVFELSAYLHLHVVCREIVALRTVTQAKQVAFFEVSPLQCCTITFTQYSTQFLKLLI